MKITVFTSNQARHVALIESLAGIAEHVWAVQECTTIFPGAVSDFFRKSEVMQRYFGRVIEAERDVFGRPGFTSPNVSQLCLKMGDVSLVGLDVLQAAMQADVFVVFGASYIKGRLCDALVDRGALNIHMGISPYFRGSSCNFWALYDGRAELVGATIHLLSKGLDSGPMLFHALPPRVEVDPFVLGMLAVRSAHRALVQRLRDGSILGLTPVVQDKSRELRYTRNADFNDAVAQAYLDRNIDASAVGQQLKRHDDSMFLHPHIDSRSS